MNGYERFMTALRREQPDRVPTWELIINRPVIDALYGPEATHIDFVEKEEMDGICVFGNYRTVKELSEDSYIGEFGVTWKLASNGVYYPHGGPITSAADVEKWESPDPDDENRFATLREAVQRFKGEKAIVFLAHETFEFSHYLMGGMSNLFLNYALEPGICLALSEKLVEYNCRIIANAVSAGADAIVTGDDYATEKGPLISPEYFETFAVPYIKRVVEASHRAGVPHIKHTDGRLWPVMEQLIGTGIDAFDPVEPLAGMDIGDMKRKFGHRIALVGNIDCSILLCRGTPEMVEEAVKETIAKASVGGGHILASSNSIHPGVRPELYRAMAQAARKYGVYPIDEDLVKQYKDRNYMEEVRKL